MTVVKETLPRLKSKIQQPDQTSDYFKIQGTNDF